MTKKRILALSLILILILSSTVFAYAEVQPRDTGVVSFTTDRISRTSAEAVISITFSTKVDRYTVAVYLQKKVNGSWVNDTTNDDYAIYESGTSAYDHIFANLYSDLSEGVNYRLKCVSTDYIGSSSYTFTAYSNQF